MEIYPAIKGNMGNWTYYTCSMTLKQVVQKVELSKNLFTDKTLSAKMQRSIDEGRVRKQIVRFLTERDDHFFSSLVVAAVGGNPTWYEVDVSDTPELSVFAGSAQFRDSIGALQLDDSRYYALDGQHRLAAIKAVVEDYNSFGLTKEDSERVASEVISVIVIIPEDTDDQEVFITQYRRLFSSLNRHAKPTGANTNIIMDEDDGFAVLTRRLIQDHSFFTSDEDDDTQHVIKTSGESKTIGANDHHFTSLQALYESNRILLNSMYRGVHGFETAHLDGNGDPERLTNMKELIQTEMSEEYRDQLYEELNAIWDGIVEIMPNISAVGHGDGSIMRSTAEEAEPGTDAHLLFRPIGLEWFATMVRAVLDQELDQLGTEEEFASTEIIKEIILRRFEGFPVSMYKSPYRNLLMVHKIPKSLSGISEFDGFVMRSEDRKAATDVLTRIGRWMLGITPHTESDVLDLRNDYEAILSNSNRWELEKEEREKVWKSLEDMRGKLVLKKQSS